jgi:hypothetical protein
MVGDKIISTSVTPAIEAPKSAKSVTAETIEYIGAHPSFYLGGAIVTPSVWTPEMLEDLVLKYPSQTKGLFKRGNEVI